jgi:CubicO group peptidase (beta-lactamase class C family)
MIQHKRLQRLLIIMTVISVLVFSTVSGNAQAQPTPANDKTLAAKLDQLLTATFPADAPGAAVIIVRDGQPILRKGYGLANLELQTPVAPEMVFRLGSITKQFTAVAILMLVEAGKVKLSDDITQYLPDYPTHGQKITVEQLLNHTSGIKNYLEVPAWYALWRKDLSLAELIALFQDEPLDFAPGTQWAYSNSGYVLLGAIIEKVSGLRYADFIQQRIFTPLGMTHSTYDYTQRIVPGRVAGYTGGKDGYLNAEYLSMSHPYAAGALLSSVDDLTKWDAALYTDKLVKQRTLQRAWQGAKLPDGEETGYGYGFALANYAGHPIVQHNGGINGFATHSLRLPQDKVFIAILTNCDSCPVSLIDLIFNLAAQVVGKPYREPIAITLPTATLATYEGVYQRSDQRELVIFRAGDQLRLLAGGEEAQVLTPSSASEFFIKDQLTRLKFVKDTTGQIRTVQMQRYFGPWRTAQKTDKPLPTARQPITLDPAIYERYVGEYQIAPNFSLTLLVKAGKLIVQPTGQDAAELFPESETTFFLTAIDAQIEFQKDDAGQVTGLLFRQGDQEFLGKKVK